jgi:hypothetical protein
MNTELACWRCGAALDDLPLPLARRAECRSCHTELHVCRMCQHYDRTVARSCREPVADEVNDKERANFCGWFIPRPRAYVPGNERPAAAAQAALDALFGKPAANAGDAAGAARRELEDLFGPREPDDRGRS